MWPDGRDAGAESTNLMDYEAQYLSEPGAVGLFTRLTRVGLLVDAFQHRCLDPFGLLFIDYSVLRVLELIGPPHRMSPTELSEILVRSSGGVTQILDRLERAGLVRALPIPTTGARWWWSSRPTACAPLTKRTRRYMRERERLLDGLVERRGRPARRRRHPAPRSAHGCASFVNSSAMRRDASS